MLIDGPQAIKYRYNCGYLYEYLSYDSGLKTCFVRLKAWDVIQDFIASFWHELALPLLELFTSARSFAVAKIAVANSDLRPFVVRPAIFIGFYCAGNVDVMFDEQ